jgi:3-oxoacyl-(acyl-carrier-protein) synthase
VRPLAITGVGIVSPIGVGRDAFTAALREPDRATEKAFLGRNTVFDEERVPSARVAELWGFDAKEYLGDKGLRNFDRLTKSLIVAARLALEDAGIKKDGAFVALSPERVGICSSTAYGSLDAITELNLVAELEDPRYINPARFPNTVINAAAGYVSIWEDLRAPNVTIVDGNSGSLDAVLTCETHLAHRRGDVFLVGGGEALTEPLYLAFRKLGAVAETKDAPGLSFGEGAAYLCVEREDEALVRGATVRGRILGYGTAFEPPLSPAVLVHASADPVRRAIASALADAGIKATDVDAVCSAACGLEPVDAEERTGIAAALGADVAVATPKAIFGETFGASGVLGMATSLAWFDGAPVAPLASGKLEGELRTVVVVTVGFYGNVSAVVVGRESRA